MKSATQREPATPEEFERMCELHGSEIYGHIDGRAYVYSKPERYKFYGGVREGFIGHVRSDATVGELIEFFATNKGD